MSELRFRPRIHRAALGLTLVVSASIYACGGDDTVLGAPDSIEGPAKDGGSSGYFDSSRTEEDSSNGKVLPPSSVSLGDGFACAVAKDRGVWCWGRNDAGQLGRDPASTPSCGAFPCTPLPAKVEGLRQRIATVKAGRDFACALDELGDLYCWGNNAKGQLNVTGVASRFAPAKVAENVAQIDAAGEHACFLGTDGYLVCWGENACDLFGRPSTPIASAAEVPGVAELSYISVGIDQMCAVSPDSTVVCWGADHKGSLGHPLPSTPGTCNGLPFDRTPKRIIQNDQGLLFTGGKEVHVGIGVACVLTTEDTIKCFGDNTHGALGQGFPETSEHRVPTEVPALKTTRLEVAGETACAIVAQKLVCWGDARYGQLDSLGSDAGCAGSGCRPFGYVVPGQDPVREFSLSATAIATIKTDNSLWLWGKNDGAEIGTAPADTGNVSCAGGSKCIPAPRMMTTAPPLE